MYALLLCLAFVAVAGLLPPEVRAPVPQASGAGVAGAAVLSGAPVASCNPDPRQLRLTAGIGPISYQFACGVNRPAGVCVAGQLAPNLLVTLGPEKDGWSCVSGGDSTAGWIPANRLRLVPDTPHLPDSAWLGWWRNGPAGPGRRANRLLIQAGQRPGELHVSGRAYWYGLGDNVHFGEVRADATPVGPYLHLIDGDGDAPCIVDLRYQTATRTLDASDNTNCGGMNVRFSRTWTRFTPARLSHSAATKLSSPNVGVVTPPGSVK